MSGGRPAMVACLSEARAAMFERLGEFDHPVTVLELTQALGQHRNTVRGHLDALVTSGLVIAEPAPSTGMRGRPAMLYRVNRETSTGHREYEQLAALLATQLASQAGAAETARQLGALWAAQILTDARERGEEIADPITVLRELGCDPQLQADGRTVVLRNCPLHEVAGDHHEVVCSMHGQMVRSVLELRGNDVTEQHVYPETVLGGCRLVVLPRIVE